MLPLVAVGGACLIIGGAIGIVLYSRVRMLEDEAADFDSRASCTAQSALQDRLADCLAGIVEMPLLTVGDPEGMGRTIELRLSSFRPEVAEHACELLEEAGR